MRIYMETLGCPKNVWDSECAAHALESAGHSVTGSVSGAGAVVVNTCGFIGDAKKESIERIFDLHREKDEGALLVVTGCLSQMYGDRLFSQLPEADIMVGVNDYAGLPELLAHHCGSRGRRFSPCASEFEEMKGRRRLGPAYSAYLKIAEGCGNSCAYCVIPSIRGGYRSRRKESILDEAASLAGQGCKELILVAQDVTAYGMDLYGRQELPDLLRRLCAIDGLRWIRLMYCYEDRITDELIEAVRDETKICKYMDMPVQHCSDSVLRSMNRRSTGGSIRETVRRLRAAVPGIHIRTTVIAGLPGEGKAEFSELSDFVEEMRFERLGVFAYSKEEGTVAAGMRPQVRKDVKERRRSALLLKQLGISLELNMGKIGSIMEVMVEGSEGGGAFIGRSRFDAPDIDNAVVFTSGRELAPGEVVDVEITDAFDYDLSGREVTL